MKTQCFHPRFYSTVAVLALLGLTLPSPTGAAVKSEPVTYKQGETTLKGHLAYDDAVTGKRPGVLVVHEWWGLNDYARQRAEALAKEGYVALAVDMYGEGKSTVHPEEAGAWSSALAKNQPLAGQRFQAALELLQKHPRVDGGKIAAIGYCFGGAVVLGMAQGGADLRGVVSFHGALPTEPVAAGTTVKARVQVHHGAADPFVTPEQVAKFQDNLAKAGADWQMNVYGGAKHSFTNPEAARFGMAALAYDAAADRRSWAAMLDFFREVFGGI